MAKWLKPLMRSIMLMGMAIPASAAQAEPYWQCAPFARMISGLQLFGKAASWWQQATGKYDRGQRPEPGSVLVFKAAGSMGAGHVAMVSKVVSDRIIKVTHANWSIINGRRGQVERDVTVVDASEKGDWSKVRVWYASLKDVGIKAYPTYGFIYGGKASNDAAHVTPAAAAPSADTTSRVDLPAVTDTPEQTS